MKMKINSQFISSIFLLLIFCLDILYFPVYAMVKMPYGAFYDWKPSIEAVSSLKFEKWDETKSESIPAEQRIPGGPDQPEFSSFTQVGNDNLVNPFTGDFSYNIPLMDVEGYPINIVYDANVGMNTESSWVGLGWSLNVGSVQRNLRGLPDDFNGDEIRIEQNVKPEMSITVGGGLGNFELFGFGKEYFDFVSQQLVPQFQATVRLGLDVGYNNYNGFNSSFSVAPTFSIADKTKNDAGPTKYNLTLGLSGSSQNGPYFRPQFGISRPFVDSDCNSFYQNFNIGSSFSTRSGWQSIEYGLSVTSRRDYYDQKTREAYSTYTTSGSLGGSHNLMQSTYYPSISMSKFNVGMTFSLKGGVDFFGLDPTFDLKGSFTYMDNVRKEEVRSQYGFLYLQNGQKNEKAILDFNREHDGAFTETTKALAIPQLTYDVFTVNAHGLNGSYIPTRKDIGYVFDARYRNNTATASFGGELAPGGILKAGIDVAAVNANSSAGVWDKNNKVNEEYSFNDSEIQFRMAGEGAMRKSLDEFNQLGGSDPVYFEIKRANSKLESNFRKGFDVSSSLNDIPKELTNRGDANQPFTVLTQKDLLAANNAGAKKITNEQLTDSYRLDHHIGEIRVVSGQGQRYIFGLATYNISQEDYIFSVGSNKSTNAIEMDDLEKKKRRNITYNNENTRNNDNGTDHFFECKKTPAYSSSFLITEILSPDYIDNDGIVGPSVNDYGTYYNFSYTKIGNYKWRTPFDKKQANFQEGLYSNSADNKASYSFGEKELWYVNKVESKNYVAIFHISNRLDGYGVTDKNGGIDSGANPVVMQKLDSISLYNRVDYVASGINAIPIQKVILTYDYSLCKNFDGNTNTSGTNSGKLTLKSIQFKFEESAKAMRNGYEFSYSNINPDYMPSFVDRWGNYKEGPQVYDSLIYITDPIMHPIDYPYVEQNLTTQDEYANAWKLTTITLPSKGKLEIEYEADQYAYVQNRRAMRMYKIKGLYYPGFTNPATGTNNPESFSVVSGDIDLTQTDAEIAVEIGESSDPTLTNANIGHFIKGLESNLVYFRVLTKIRAANSQNGLPARYEYVPGFGELDFSATNRQPRIYDDGTNKYVVLTFKKVNLKDNGNGTDVNPIIKTSIQFARMYLNNYIPPGIQNLDEQAFNNGPEDFIRSLGGAFESYKELFTGPNQGIYNEGDICRTIVSGCSYARLFSANPNKIGGGYRVKKITVSDNWGEFIGNPSLNNSYSKIYEYVTEDGITSGVATYEPMAGGDENTFRQPVFYKMEYLGAPSMENYQMEPFGESYFPSAMVGYSRVVVRNEERADITSNATGYEVFEYFTSKDYPTIVRHSTLNENDDWKSYDQITRNINAVFVNRSSDKASASQGFVVENNNMNGVLKKHSTYGAGVNANGDPIEITREENIYLQKRLTTKSTLSSQMLPQGMKVPESFQLKNEVSMIDSRGNVSSGVLGLDYDLLMDFRESKTNVIGGSTNTNLNTVPFLGIPIFLGQITSEATKFRSAVVMKTINRYGIIDSVKTSSIGKLSEARNMTYDEYTGEVILSKVKNEFNDEFYSLKYPAHWYYPQMGKASISANERLINNSNQNQIYSAIDGGKLVTYGSSMTVGDEILISGSYSNQLVDVVAWIIDKKKENGKETYSVVNSNGDAFYLEDVDKIIVLRSGNRNMQSATMMSLITSTNPLAQFKSGVFNEVLESSAIEYSDEWRRKCNCTGDTALVLESTNPYFTGERGRWQPKTTYAYLTERTQTYENKNSNIRHDGYYSSYSPFYYLNDNKFSIDKSNWTFASQLLDINKNGGGIQSNDAIGIYGSSISSFNRTRVSAMSGNSQLKEMGFDSFEDNYPGRCLESDFYFEPNAISKTIAHTGRNSIKVQGGTPVTLDRQLVKECSENVQCDFVITAVNSTQSGYSNVKKINPQGEFELVDYQIEILEGSIEFESFENGELKIGSNQPFIVKVVFVNEKGCNSVKIIQ